LHLADIAIQITPGTHAALPVDQADWHLSGRLIVPPNITLIPLPPKRSEPAGKHLAAHARKLAHQKDLQIHDDIVDHCCDAWSKLVDQRWRDHVRDRFSMAVR
jgi:hypothetical protein